jgi:hypothetical protein
MKSGKHIEKMVEETLNSLDGINRAEVPGFFFTRLQARMDNQPSAKSFWNLLSRPAVSLVSLSLLLVLNIVALTSYVKTARQPVSQENTAGIQSFAQEFNLSATSVYNNKSMK